MPETHPNHLHPAAGSKRLARELDQLHDPVNIQVSGVLRSADEHSVDGVQIGVCIRMVDHVVGGDGKVRLQGVRGDGALEEVCKDAPVALVLGIGVGDGSVCLENGKTNGVLGVVC